MLKIPPALRHSRYFYLWAGLLVSIAGSQMQLAAIHWHIRELTGTPDPLALGGIGLARILPIILFSFISGPVADTFNRRKVLFITQTTLALIAGELAYLTFTDQITIWHIYALTSVFPRSNPQAPTARYLALNTTQPLSHPGWEPPAKFQRYARVVTFTEGGPLVQTVR